MAPVPRNQEPDAIRAIVALKFCKGTSRDPVIRHHPPHHRLETRAPTRRQRRQPASHAPLLTLLRVDPAPFGHPRRVERLDGTEYLASAGTITPDSGYDTYYVSGTTAINTINATFRGQRMTIILTDIGGTINDAAVGGGNILLITAGGTVASGAGRTPCELQFDGANWRQL